MATHSHSCLENPMDRGAWQSTGSQRVRHYSATKQLVNLMQLYDFIYHCDRTNSEFMSLTWTCHWSSNIISLTADLTEQILTPVCLSHLHCSLKPAPSAAPVCSPPRNTVTMNPVALAKPQVWSLGLLFFTSSYLVYWPGLYFQPPENIPNLLPFLCHHYHPFPGLLIFFFLNSCSLILVPTQQPE